MDVFETLDNVVSEVLPSQEDRVDGYRITSNLFVGLGGFGLEQVVYHMEHGAALYGLTTLENTIAGFLCTSIAVILRDRARQLSSQ